MDLEENTSAHTPNRFIDMTAAEIRAGLLASEFTAAEIAEESLARIEAYDGEIHAFLEVTAHQAREAAARIDAAIAAGEGDTLGPLAGVPVAFKDNMHWAGTHTTCGSSLLANLVSTQTADCVQRVLDADAILLGKLNLDEFAFGSSTETSAFGNTHNPWDLERVPGGSSGGSVAAAAAGLVNITLGSDAGGSIRQPGAFCGVVAVKPSYGTISRRGIAAFVDTVDQAGPIARSVLDAALAMNVLADGGMRAEGECAGAEVALTDAEACLAQAASPEGVPAVDYVAACGRGVKDMRIGVVPAFLDALGLQAEVREAIVDAADALRSMGAELVEVELPHADAAMDAYYVIGPRAAFANLGNFDARTFAGDMGVIEEAGVCGEDAGETSAAACGSETCAAAACGSETCADVAFSGAVPDQTPDFGAEAKRRIARGEFLTNSSDSAQLLAEAEAIRELVKQDYDRAFAQVDAILAPVTPRTAFKFGEITDPDEMHLCDMFTVSVNIAGNGGMSMPVGLGKDSGLPVGVQVISPANRDESMFRVAGALERAYGPAPVAPAFV